MAGYQSKESKLKMEEENVIKGDHQGRLALKRTVNKKSEEENLIKWYYQGSLAVERYANRR